MTNPQIKKAIKKKNWTLKDWEKSKDPIDRLVWFISIQSPHNLWRGYEALITQLEEMEREVIKKIEKLVDKDGHVNEDMYEKWLEQTGQEGLYDGIDVGNGIKFVIYQLSQSNNKK